MGLAVMIWNRWLRPPLQESSTLLIEADRRIAGRLDGVTGRIEIADLSHPQVDDLLDDLGELVSEMGGRVMVIPAGQMPGQTGLAATYRH